MGRRVDWYLLAGLTAMIGAALASNWLPGMLFVAVGLAAFNIHRMTR